MASDHALSDFDVMRERLVNWGRWGRQDSCRPDPESVTAGIYHMGRADRQGEGESGDESEPDLPPINSRDAESLDVIIQNMRTDYRRIICTYYYRRTTVYRPTLAEAIRALCDVDDAKQQQNKLLRGRFG